MSFRFGGRFARGVIALSAVAVMSSISASPARAQGLFGGSGDDEEEGGWSEKIGDTFKKTMTGVGKSVGLGGKPEAPPPPESPSGCPAIGVLDGTLSNRVMAAGASGNQGVRYQFSLGNVGRQCTIAGSSVAIKVGAEGRVLLGPAGSAGRFDVPIRVVVFNERQKKTVASKLYRVPASIAAGQVGTPFQFASDEIVVPNSGYASQEYSIKVGIDTGGKGNDVAVSKRKSRRQKPVASASQ